MSDNYALFVVTAAMFLTDQKSPNSVLCRISQGTIIPSLVLIGQVMSEEKSFEKLLTTMTEDDNRRQVMAIAYMAFGKVSKQ